MNISSNSSGAQATSARDYKSEEFNPLWPRPDTSLKLMRRYERVVLQQVPTSQGKFMAKLIIAPRGIQQTGFVIGTMPENLAYPAFHRYEP